MGNPTLDDRLDQLETDLNLASATAMLLQLHDEAKYDPEVLEETIRIYEGIKDVERMVKGLQERV